MNYNYRSLIEDKEAYWQTFGWVVGLLEGEGCFQINFDKRVNRAYPRVKLEMCDYDVVAEFQHWCEMEFADLLSVTAISHYEREGDHSDVYIYRLNGEVAMKLMDLVYPYMSARRKAKIQDIRKVCHNYSEDWPDADTTD